MAKNSSEEPDTAPQPDRWYDLVLGPSFNQDSSNKYCTLRYEFKPASIDKSRSGVLHKNKDNRVSVEFQNNQVGKPKVTFEGSSEDYKENDAVLFFDGETFRLERLHKAVNRLKHLRLPGESAVAAQSALAVEPRLSPIAKGAKPVNVNRSSVTPVPVEVERIDIGNPEKTAGEKPNGKEIVEEASNRPNSDTLLDNNNINEDSDGQQDVDFEEIFGACTPENENLAEEKAEFGSDTNVEQPQEQQEQHHHDDDEEIADVDDSGDEAEMGRNAADVLRAQVMTKEKIDESSSSSSSGSGSGSSSSNNSSSTSSDSEGSDDDSINSI